LEINIREKIFANDWRLLCKLHKIGQLILWKISEIVATRCQF